MAYTVTNWQDGVTPVDASNMNKIEQAISEVADTVDSFPTIQSGVTDSNVTCPANSSVDVTITYPTGFASAPSAVVCCFGTNTSYIYSGSASVGVVSNGRNGFTARIWNTSSNEVNQKIYWIAVQ